MREQTDRRKRILIAVVGFVVSAIATVVAFEPAPAPPAAAAKSGPAGSDDAEPAVGKSRELRFGLSYADTLTWMSDGELNASLDDARKLGAQWIRVDLAWNNIEPDIPGRYEWHRFDRVADAARARGLEVLATVAYTPAWARVEGCVKGLRCAPADPAAFADFTRRATERYAPKGVHTWQIWNEPNIPFWSPKPDPAAYTKLLKSSSRAIKSVDPGATVLMGGLASVSSDDLHIAHSEFLRAVAKLGALDAVDAISYHPYTYPHLASARTKYGSAFEDISASENNLASILELYGKPKMPIWLTETGAPTSGPGNVSDGTRIPANTTHVTEEFQARIAEDLVTTTGANPRVAVLFWFADQDSARVKDNRSKSRYFGLRRFDGSAKPSFKALQKAIAAYKKSRPDAAG
ncbi:hypothetical protein SRB5_29060 [Streptomyces sp. RB5]|uniref:Glycoside hydrolase family 5 domain-containing protein n=1 Tax=Streptomyces smaragdinus TaxID=2585196 RepID=A0A7K0CH13_9ACTN|nr:cellulase family glycosylhydrolase [Streptomyces smaragdinus]MQY12767.1 hypothetical protein [Streptomyces smaragdinus]